MEEVRFVELSFSGGELTELPSDTDAELTEAMGSSRLGLSPGPATGPLRPFPGPQLPFVRKNVPSSVGPMHSGWSKGSPCCEPPKEV